MKMKEEIVSALQKPQKASFRVTFEIFASTDRRAVAKWPRKLDHYVTEPAMNWIYKRGTITLEEAETAKARAIERERSNIDVISEEIINRVAKHTERYNKIKEYFLQKTQELGLINPLVFFDDKALRIDIGYGRKQFEALFPDFLEYRGIFDTVILGKVRFSGPSPSKYFNTEYSNEDYKEYLENENQKLLIKPLEPRAPKKKITIGVTTGLKETELIQRVLHSHQGITIGEAHTMHSPKQFLVDNMTWFKMQGVTTLYMEHLLQDPHQILLDEYLRSPRGTPIPLILERYLNLLDTEHGLSGTATFTQVVKSAKENGIRIIAIDTEATYGLALRETLGDLGDDSASKMRYKAMNQAMVERYEENNDGGKFIAFVGNAHVSTMKGIPGLSDVLDCPNVVIADLDEATEETIAQNVEYHGVRCDVLYHRHSTAKKSLTAPSLERLEGAPITLAPTEATTITSKRDASATSATTKAEADRQAQLALLSTQLTELHEFVNKPEFNDIPFFTQLRALLPEADFGVYGSVRPKSFQILMFNKVKDLLKEASKDSATNALIENNPILVKTLALAPLPKEPEKVIHKKPVNWPKKISECIASTKSDGLIALNEALASLTIPTSPDFEKLKKSVSYFTGFGTIPKMHIIAQREYTYVLTLLKKLASEHPEILLSPIVTNILSVSPILGAKDILFNNIDAAKGFLAKEPKNEEEAFLYGLVAHHYRKITDVKHLINPIILFTASLQNAELATLILGSTLPSVFSPETANQNLMRIYQEHSNNPKFKERFSAPYQGPTSLPAILSFAKGAQRTEFEEIIRTDKNLTEIFNSQGPSPEQIIAISQAKVSLVAPIEPSSGVAEDRSTKDVERSDPSITRQVPQQEPIPDPPAGASAVSGASKITSHPASEVEREARIRVTPAALAESSAPAAPPPIAKNIIIKEIEALKNNIRKSENERKTTWYAKEKIAHLDAIAGWLKDNDKTNLPQILGMIRDVCATHRHHVLLGGWGPTHSSIEFDNWFQNTFQKQFPSINLPTERSKPEDLKDVKATLDKGKTHYDAVRSLKEKNSEMKGATQELKDNPTPSPKLK